MTSERQEEVPAQGISCGAGVGSPGENPGCSVSEPSKPRGARRCFSHAELGASLPTLPLHAPTQQSAAQLQEPGRRPLHGLPCPSPAGRPGCDSGRRRDLSDNRLQLLRQRSARSRPSRRQPGQHGAMRRQLLRTDKRPPGLAFQRLTFSCPPAPLLQS